MQPFNNEWSPELKEAVTNAHRETYREVDIEALRKAAHAKLPKNHLWQQQGPNVVCTSCRPSHSQYVGTDKNLVFDPKTGQYDLVNRF